MKKIKTETLILGAGPAGLACALELYKNNHDFIVVEKDPEVGGLSKTYRFESGGKLFLTDNGPHRFFSHNKELYKLIESLVGDRWKLVKRSTRQYIDGKYYDYPVNIIQAIRNIGFCKGAKFIFDYLYARLVFGFNLKKIRTFYDYAVSSFGKGLAEFNIINYTEKIWGLPCNNIHPHWAQQRIKGVSLVSVLSNYVFSKFKKDSGVKSMVNYFYYPKFGTGTIYGSIANIINSDKPRLFLNSNVTSIKSIDGKFKSLSFIKDGEEYMVEFEHLVESILPRDFVNLANIQNESLSDALSKLKYRSQVYVFLMINKDRVTSDQWIYFPNTAIGFSRMSEMKNFDESMCPENMTSLFIEYFCNEGDSVWSLSDKDMYRICLGELMKLNLLNEEEVLDYKVIRKANVYPVYDLSYIRYLDIVKSIFDGYKNLSYIGRPGRFLYNNQDHSLEMGLIAARNIIDRKAKSLDNIANEDEYFEDGEIDN